MELSLEEAKKLARLARLALGDDELEALRGQLQGIVGYVEQLSEVDVEGVEPLTHAVTTAAAARADVASHDVIGREALRGSAGYEDGLVRLPRIVE